VPLCGYGYNLIYICSSPQEHKAQAEKDEQLARALQDEDQARAAQRRQGSQPPGRGAQRRSGAASDVRQSGHFKARAGVTVRSLLWVIEPRRCVGESVLGTSGWEAFSKLVSGQAGLVRGSRTPELGLGRLPAVAYAAVLLLLALTVLVLGDKAARGLAVAVLAASLLLFLTLLAFCNGAIAGRLTGSFEFALLSTLNFFCFCGMGDRLGWDVRSCAVVGWMFVQQGVLLLDALLPLEIVAAGLKGSASQRATLVATLHLHLALTVLMLWAFFETGWVKDTSSTVGSPFSNGVAGRTCASAMQAGKTLRELEIGCRPWSGADMMRVPGLILVLHNLRGFMVMAFTPAHEKSKFVLLKLQGGFTLTGISDAETREDDAFPDAAA